MKKLLLPRLDQIPKKLYLGLQMVTKNKFSTRCVHEGEIKDTMYQGIVSPLFMSTTYPWFGGDSETKPYPRYFNTPNQEFLSKKIASLENGEKALIFTSGMAAISTSIMANVKTSMYNKDRCYIYNKAMAKYYDHDPHRNITVGTTHQADIERINTKHFSNQDELVNYYVNKKADCNDCGESIYFSKA